MSWFGPNKVDDVGLIDANERERANDSFNEKLDISKRLSDLEKNSHPPVDFSVLAQKSAVDSLQDTVTTLQGLVFERLGDLEQKARSSEDFTLRMKNVNERLSTLEVKFEDLMSKLYAPGQAIAGLQVNMERCFGRVADLEKSDLGNSDRCRLFELQIALKDLTNLLQQVMLVQDLESFTVPTVPEVPEHIEVRKKPRSRS